MRLWIIIGLVVVTLGCRTTDSSSRREIALLRTEILDLEDQYYALKSQCEAEGMVVQDQFSGGQIIDGYTDQYYPTGSTCADCGSPVYQAGGQQIVTSPIYEGQQFITEHPIITEHSNAIEPQYLEGSPEPDLRTPEVIHGREIIDPLGQPFEETLSDPDFVGSNRITRPQHSPQHRQAKARQQRAATSRFQPDSRFGIHQPEAPTLQVNDGNQTSEGWVQNRRPATRDVDLFTDYETERPRELARNGRGGHTSQTQSRWHQSSTQLPAAGSNRRAAPEALSSQPLDDRYLTDEGYDEFSDLSNEDLGVRSNFAAVEQIFIDPEYTYGRDFDNDGEQDGISLLIQPLDEQGRVVALAADLVVSLIDPSETGKQQRIGLWKYESYQVESLVSNQRGQRGLALELPWQRRVPRNDRLLIFVRYTTPQGERLETSLDVRIDAPDSGYELEIGDNVVNRQSNNRNVRTIPTTAGNQVEMPKWRPVR